VNRFSGALLTLASCLVLACCGGELGDEAAQAACAAYAKAPSSLDENTALRTTALERAQRAGEANESYAALQSDMQDAWSRSDALAATHNSGGTVSAHQLDAYFAADKRVRSDCADAGADIGPLEP
jgi:hypothetical protein